MRILSVSALIVALVVGLFLSLDLSTVAAWAVDQQRGFQNQMAGAIRALRADQPGAWLALMGAAGAYGFVHAVGPGHGKYMIGGVGLGSAVSAPRLLGIALVSSLAQALWAVTLVYGGFFLLELTAAQMTVLAEDVLAPASYLAICAVGVILAGRGLRRLARPVAPVAAGHAAHDHEHGHECACHSHGPSPEQVAGLRSMREAMALIASIAIRPCTGAIFLLVIAWQMDIRTAGAAAVVVMGLGTAGLTSLVAVSSVAARGLAFSSMGPTRALPLVYALAQVSAGAAIIWISLVMLRVAL
ncbi:nickel/cobalt transporter [Mameliella sediminis]|uniref:nickel/cobalt transporter n=1 Tax=Mameliella sediminis TaxID=2836866 RepID=UPI001C46692A|nr:hypothetical protein [Mameliella sediminis]MBV7392956.1 hypothetical protein [Mameliella sediminis]